MKALELQRKSMRLNTEAPQPTEGKGEILIRVEYAGICGTDLELRNGYLSFEGVPGHEFVGVVVDGDESGLSGKRVVSEINCGCGSCDYCQESLRKHCGKRSVIGIDGRAGAFAEAVVVPVENVHLLPDTIPDRTGVMVEPFAAALKGVEDSEGSSGRIGILGDGPIGIMSGIAALLTGREALLIGKHEDKLKVAEGFGVDTVLIDKFVNSGAAGEFDRIVDSTGSRSGLELALNLIRPRGRIVVKTTIAANYNLSLSSIVINEVELLGSRCGKFDKAIDLLDRNEVSLEPLISAIFPLDEWERAFARASDSDSLKVLFHMKDG